jgi:MarR family transcriptional regulator, lower aerobic nicotinate degradation pathway regulator
MLVSNQLLTNRDVGQPSIVGVTNKPALARSSMTDKTTPSRLSQAPTWLISQTSTHAHRLLSQAFAKADSRGYHYRLLAALQELGPASQAALGRRTEIDRSDVVAAVNELAGRGFVKREADPGDRRRNVVSITPAGRARLRRLERVVAKVQDELLAPLSSRERRLLIDLLGRVLDHQAS